MHVIHVYTKVGLPWRSTVAFYVFISALEEEYLYRQTAIQEEELLEVTNFWELLIQAKEYFSQKGLGKDLGLGLSFSPLDYMALWNKYLG